MTVGGTEANGQSGGPAISADGRSIAFTSHASNLTTGDTNGRADVFVRDRTAGTTALVSVVSSLPSPAPSPVADPPSQIYSVGLDGDGRTNLSGGRGLDGLPAPGPDGRIAFVRWGTGQLWVMQGDGTDQRRLTTAGEWGTPVWSPDGRELAVQVWDYSPCGTSDRNCALSRIALVSAVDGSLHRLIRSRDRGATDPSWSPNGAQIAYAGRLDSGLAAHAIETVRRNGTGKRTLVSTRVAGAQRLTAPEWSPHGDSIAFERGGWIWLVLADGGPPQRHVRGTAPAWSPDGRRLAFARSGRIGVINVETGRVQLIARGRFGAWSRTGRQLAFTAVTKDGTAIYIADVTGTRMRSVIAETSADVRVAGYSSDGTRLLYVRVARP